MRLAPLVPVLALACGQGAQGRSASFELSGVDESAWMSPGQEITLEAITTDASGNATSVGWDDVAMTFSPDGAAEPLGEGRFRLVAEGLVVMRGRVSVDEVSLEDTVVVQVDGQAPELTLTAPLPGEMLEGAGPVQVSGVASDSGSGVEQILVNGVAADLASDGTFTASVAPTAALNVVEVVGTDRTGLETSVRSAWLQADAWSAVGEPLPRASVLRLGPDSLSDGALEETYADDLAQATTAVSIVSPGTLRTVGPIGERFNVLTPTACPVFLLVDSISFELAIDQVTSTSPREVDLMVADGVAEVTWRDRLSIGLEGEIVSSYRRMNVRFVPFVGCEYGSPSGFIQRDDMEVSFSVEVAVRARFPVSKVSEGPLSSDVSLELVEMGDLEDLQVPGSFLIGWGLHEGVRADGYARVGAFTTLEDLRGPLASGLELESSLEELLGEGRTAALTDALQSVGARSEGPVGRGETPTTVISMLDEVSELGEGASLTTAMTVTSEAARGPGAWSRGDCLDASAASAPDLSGAGTLGVGVSLDAVNQLTHTSWASSRDLQRVEASRWSSRAPEGLELVGVTVTPQIPTVLHDCRDDLSAETVAQVDLELNDGATSRVESLVLAVDAGVSAEAEPSWRVTTSSPSNRVIVGGGDPDLEALAAIIAHDVLIADELDAAFARLPAPSMSLAALHPKGLVLQPLGPYRSEGGYLVLDACPTTSACEGAAPAGWGPRSCLDDRTVGECVALTGTCSAVVADEICEADAVCAESEDDATCEAPS